MAEREKKEKSQADEVSMAKELGSQRDGLELQDPGDMCTSNSSISVPDDVVVWIRNVFHSCGLLNT
jgi:hypothetical protein